MHRSEQYKFNAFKIRDKRDCQESGKRTKTFSDSWITSKYHLSHGSKIASLNKTFFFSVHSLEALWKIEKFGINGSEMWALIHYDRDSFHAMAVSI